VLLDPIVRLACDSLRIIAEEQGVGIELEGSPRVNVLIPAASIHRCVVALLDNAVRFSPAGTTIRVTLRADRARAQVRVIDAGPGITGIDPARVFDRFARGDAAASDGFGIGLALVKGTVERYGGSVAVESTGVTGTTILLRLPRVRRS
jgi:signal transduction histidine kinase